MQRQNAQRKRHSYLYLTFLFLLSFNQPLDANNLPLVSINYITDSYQGSFKVDYKDSTSFTNYTEGRVAYNPAKHSVFIDSNHQHDAVAEFYIPTSLSKSSIFAQLPNAINAQPFFPIFKNVDTGNPQALDKIGGMAVINDKLFVQAYKTYDANYSVTHTTAIFNNANNLHQGLNGFFEMDGAARTVNYLSAIPLQWQKSFGPNNWIAGNGAGMSINGRFSEGPSLYSFSIAEITNSPSNIPTDKLMDFPHTEALSTTYQPKLINGTKEWDSYNESGLNDMWVQVSSAWYGFIIPNTRTYAVIGSSGNLKAGGGYKIINDAGYLCPGPCAKDNTDYYSYYWLFDIEEILSSNSPSTTLPYEYGKFDDRFLSHDKQGGLGLPSGGSFDPKSGVLIISYSDVDGRGSPPVFSVFQLEPEIIPPATTELTLP